MKRIFVIIGILVIGLGVALGWRLYQQDEEKRAPSGGTGTVEGIEVDIVARLSARIRRILVDEGDRVRADQLLVELDCREPEALLAQAEAQVGVGAAALRGAEVATRAAGYSARSARAAARAARKAAESARSRISAAAAAEAAAAAVRKALEAERKLAQLTVRRMSVLKQKQAGTEMQYDNASGRASSLAHRVESAAANISAAHSQRQTATGSAAAALAQAQAAVARARASLTQVAGSKVQVEAARQRLAAARATLARTKIAVAECRLTAPRPGVILTRSFEPGEVVLPGARILTLADLREVKTTFFIPNANLGDASPGRKVEVVADAYPGQVFRGRILSVSSKAEFTPRNVQTREDRDRLVYAVKVKVPNPEGRLRPGMPVEVRIPGTQRVR